VDSKHIIPTQESLDIVREIAKSVRTFHHHYHILYDIARLFLGDINYVEIGTFHGASACLMLQRPNTNVITIDKGVYVPKEEVINNLSRFNLNSHSNQFYYMEKDSQKYSTMLLVSKMLLLGIHILFIDGDHSPEGLIRDFNLYEKLIVKNGYIVFDDYNDLEYNPQIKPIIDVFTNGLYGYEIIGTIKNKLGAEPKDIKEGNCFIIKKK